MRYTFILLITFIFVGCGPFNTIDSFESDGIYDLGDRHISGIPTNLPAITIKDISNVC